MKNLEGTAEPQSVWDAAMETSFDIEGQRLTREEGGADSATIALRSQVEQILESGDTSESTRQLRDLLERNHQERKVAGEDHTRLVRLDAQKDILESALLRFGDAEKRFLEAKTGESYAGATGGATAIHAFEQRRRDARYGSGTTETVELAKDKDTDATKPATSLEQAA